MSDFKPEYRKFAEAFAKLVINRDFDAAVGLFAPWLQSEVSPEQLRAELDKEAAEMAQEWQMETIAYPADFMLDSNPLDLQGLREVNTPEHAHGRPYKRIPDEVTDANYRKWLVIQYLPDSDAEIEFDAFYDFWFILVEIAEQFRIGYYKVEDPD
jgi:hypothetical protein